MTSADKADLAVVGGGPAGAVTALQLARAGAAVVLCEASHYDTLRLGETLPPSVNPLLAKLGLWDRFQALAPMPSYQTASVWGGDELRDRSFIFSPFGHGWHVDRARFDAMLVEAAEAAGVRVLRGTRVRAVRRGDADFEIDADRPLRAARIVDASGRPARVARTLGAERRQLDRLACAARVFAIGGAPAEDTFIEAVEDGWWYVSPLPEGRRMIAFFTDAQEIARRGLARADGWTAALARSERCRGLACGTPDDAIHVAGCASHELAPCAGDDWIAVGDAALAVDPLSSGGVAFALRSAVAAADAVCGGDRSAYVKLVAGEASEYRRVRSEIYGWEQRFADCVFWRARAA
jgi:flavin-dependent dehydrogenase